jgi:hypothetical protein
MFDESSKDKSPKLFSSYSKPKKLENEGNSVFLADLVFLKVRYLLDQTR